MVTGLHTKIHSGSFVYAVANDSNVDPSHIGDLGLSKYPYLWAMKSADQVIAQTDHQQELLETYHGIEAVKIPNGYDVPSEADLVDHTNRKYVLWVGSMDPDQKHPRRFLKLAKSLPEVNFRMIGPPDNDQPDHAEQIEREAETIPNIEYLGYVDPDEIHDHYRDAIALVNTSDYEGFPNVFLESWRYATPVVSLYHTLDGVIVDEPVGIHAGTMDGLVDAVDQLASDVSLREELGTGGRDYMSEHYSFDQLIEKYEQVFQDVAP